jgi:Tol biopolymer transport system component/tRNA A-37 threonylcarbamoyl transferase component Bud32
MMGMIGRHIANYEILDTLGQGGMGVVYKARDRQLERLVALKVLTPDRVANSERKLRFVQEAKAASALNHPHIVTIYNIGNEDGADFIVMEFIAGRTLDRVIPRGGLKPAEVLKYGIQIADALARAHAAGIVHRDLKPGNIMISDEGQVKLLDFGLAKLSDLHDASDAELTRQTAPETEEGRILGTVCYMSPEQAEARKADPRSDIFSFGAVLYEMATGQRAFVGRSKISTLAAILQSEPQPAAELHSGLPRDLARIIERCLRKDPAWRYQSAADLKISLSDLQRETESGTAELTPSSAGTVRPKRRGQGVAAALALGLAAGAAGAWWLASLGASHTAPSVEVRPLTTYAGNESEPALSPDGKQIAFAWDGPNRDNYDIYMRLVEGGTALRLTTDTAPDHAPAWSPDGQRLAFLRDSAIYIIPALGGVERKLLQLPRGSLFLNLSAPTSISWSPDGRFLAFNSAEDGAPSIWIASTESGEYRRASTPPKGDYMEISPAFSPDGRALAYIRARDSYSRAIILQDMNRDGTPQGREREITSYERRIEQLAWQPDGRGLILAVRSMGERSGLFRLKLGGTPEPLGIDSGILMWPSLSRTGDRLAYQKRMVDTNIYRMDGPGPDGGPRPYEQCHVAVVVDSTAHDREPMLSPDGRRLVFNSDRLGYYEIHVAGADGSNQVALTSMGPTALGSPRWAPDNQTVVFDRYENGHSMIYTIGAEGGKPRRITGDQFRDIRPSFSRDGKSIYFSSNRSGRIEVWKVPAEGGTPQQITHNSGIEAFESPDGKLLYYVSGQGLWALPVAGGDPKPVLGEALFLLYAVAGRSIYYGVRNPPGLWVLRTDTGRKFEYVRFPRESFGFDGGTVFSVSADERTILFSQTDRMESDLMLLEHFR